MSMTELSLSLRTKGRPKGALTASVLRPLGEADLALLDAPRSTSEVTPLVKLRDRHHALARVLAAGKTNAEASAITGYDPSRISILRRSPAFVELVDHYAKVQEGAAAEFTDRATTVALTALGNLQEMLEDDTNPLAPSMQLEIAKTFADRTGHAPIQRMQQTNVNIDLGGRLAAARKRVEEARIVSVTSLPSEGE